MGSAIDMSSRKHIVVVGGSLAALMSGIPLMRLGHKVTILERSPTPLLHNQGAGVVAGGETQAFYNKHDLSKTPIAVRSKQRLYLDKKGEIMDEEDSSQRMTSWDLLYYLGRANFDQVDSEYLEGGKAPPRCSDQGEAKYEFGRVVTAVHDAGEKVKIEYEDTREDGKHQPGGIEADFLIAADGPSSRLRRMLVPGAAERKYAGYVAFRGTVREDQISRDAEDVFVEKFTFFHGPGTQIL
jgi:2-polyprenyl-6-methoxyphenol hydroxylase-like FAD-dependent oxidoreductase